MAERHGPLTGIRVLDLTQYVSGPLATMILGDLGADVIKIERPPDGDVYRRQGPEFLDGESISFLALNRNKRSVALDLGSADGRKIVRDLLQGSDVLVQNLKPGAAERLGLGRDDVRQVAPHVVWAGLSGYGGRGPRGMDGGYDLMIQGEVGLMELTGEKQGPPAKAGVAVVDIASGTNLALGIVAALFGRARDGSARTVDTSLYEVGVSLTSIQAERVLNFGAAPRRAGSASSLFAPYEAFRTSDGYITVEGTGPAGAWERFCDALAAPHLAGDERFRTNVARLANLDALRHEAETRTTANSTEYWEKAFRDRGLPCGPIREIASALDSEQTAALEIVVDAPHTTAGSYRTVRGPVRYDGLPTPVSGAPVLGEHTREVLSDLGLTAGELDRLQYAGVISAPVSVE